MGKEATDTRSSSVKTGWPQHFNYARKQNVSNARLGSGERFDKLSAKLAENPKIKNPDAVAAAIGRKKYGKNRFQKMAAEGTPGY